MKRCFECFRIILPGRYTILCRAVYYEKEIRENLFVSQSLDGVQLCRLACGVEAEEDTESH